MSEPVEYRSDTELVSLLRRDPRDGLHELYRTYADRLLGFSLTITHNRALAEDAVQDSLLVAVGAVGKLRQPERLRPWLFAITRNECLRQLRHQQRNVPTGAPGQELGTESEEVNFAMNLDRQFAQSTVQRALPAMNPADRDVITMALANDMDAPDTAAALGLSLRNTHARLTRAKRSMAECVTALAVFDSDCPELAQLVDRDAAFGPLQRKRVVKHTRDCGRCEQRRRAAFADSQQALAAPLEVTPSPELRARILDLTDAELATRAEALVARVGSFDPEGFPATRRSPWRRLGWGALLLVLLSGLLAFAAVGEVTELSVTPSPGPEATGSPAPEPSGSPSASRKPRPQAERPSGLGRGSRVVAGGGAGSGAAPVLGSGSSGAGSFGGSTAGSGNTGGGAGAGTAGGSTGSEGTSGAPAPAPGPAPAPRPTPSTSSKPTQKPKPKPKPTRTPSPSPTPTRSPSPSVSPTPSPTGSPTPTPSPTTSPSPSPSPTPTPTPTGSPTRTPTATPTRPPISSASVSVVATPVPAPAPTDPGREPASGQVGRAGTTTSGPSTPEPSAAQ